MNQSLNLQTIVVLPPKFPWKWCIHKYDLLARKSSTIKAPSLSRRVRAHTYNKRNMGGFWYPYLFGSTRVSTFSTPDKFTCKICSMYSIITKLCKVARTSTMCTRVHISIHIIMCVSMMSMCMAWRVCMQMWSTFLLKHGF